MKPFTLVLLLGLLAGGLVYTAPKSHDKTAVTVADGTDPLPACRKNVCPPLQ